VWGSSRKLYVVITSQDDQQPPTIYYTGENVDAADKVHRILAGKKTVVALRSDDSVEFGGGTSDSALLDIDTKSTQQPNSQIAEGGSVIELTCKLKVGE